MKKNQWLALVIASLLVCVYRWYDVMNALDPTTGFALSGALWQRYAAVFFVVALSVLFAFSSRRGNAAPAAFGGSNFLAGAALLVALAFLFSGAARLWVSYATGSALEIAGDAALLISGAWFFVLYFYFAFPSAKGAFGGLLFALAGCAFFTVQCISRFALRPTSIARPGYILAVLSAVCALALCTCVLRTVCLPGEAFSGWNTLCGVLAFLMCFCCTLPQFVLLLQSAQGAFAPDALLLLPEVALGLFGLVFSYSFLPSAAAQKAARAPKKAAPATALPAKAQRAAAPRAPQTAASAQVAKTAPASRAGQTAAGASPREDLAAAAAKLYSGDIPQPVAPAQNTAQAKPASAASKPAAAAPHKEGEPVLYRAPRSGERSVRPAQSDAPPTVYRRKDK